MKGKIILAVCFPFLLLACADENNYAGQSITDENTGGGIDAELSMDHGQSTRGKGPREIQENSVGGNANDQLQDTSDSITTQD